MNIQFKKVHIQNFLSISEAIVELNEQGFVLVKGINNESDIPQSNGAGKSAWADAIFWTLNGETIRGATEVVNEKSTNGTICELDFYVDNTYYKIIRSKQSKEYGNAVLFYKDEELLADQTKKAQELINRYIPSVSPQVLGSIVLLGQGLPYRFTGLSPSKRKDLLEVMSGSSSKIDKLKLQLDKENNTYSKLINDTNLENSRLAGLNTGLSTSKEAINEKIASQISEEEANEKIAVQIKEKERLNKNLKIIADTLGSYTEKQTNINTIKDNVFGAISEKKAIKSTLQKQLTEFKTGICPTCKRPYDIDEHAEASKTAINNSITEIDEAISTLTTKHKDVLADLDKVNKEIWRLNKDVTSINLQIQNCDHEIITLKSKLVETTGLDEQIKSLEKQINDNTAIINKNADVIQHAEKLVTCIAYLKRELSRDFKGYLLVDIINYLSTRSAFYSDYLFTNKEKSVQVVLEGNKVLILLGDREYENLSGGERQRVDIAVQFALRDMLMLTTGFSCNILTLDEAFDNLDEQGCSSLIKLVTQELSDIESIFIVTHHAEIDIPYDKQMTVIKNKEGLSRIEMS